MTLKDSTAGNEELFAGEFNNRWSKFRDALRREDQLIWDEMFKAPEIHREAVSAMSSTSGFEATFMAMMIEQRRLDDELDGKSDDLENRLAALERNIKSHV